MALRQKLMYHFSSIKASYVLHCFTPITSLRLSAMLSVKWYWVNLKTDFSLSSSGCTAKNSKEFPGSFYPSWGIIDHFYFRNFFWSLYIQKKTLEIYFCLNIFIIFNIRTMIFSSLKMQTNEYKPVAIRKKNLIQKKFSSKPRVFKNMTQC